MIDITVFLIKTLEVVQYIKKILYNVDNEVEDEENIYSFVIFCDNFNY